MEDTKQTRRHFLKNVSITATAFSLPTYLGAIPILETMNNKKEVDVVIVGGSFAGLSAAMALVDLYDQF